MYLGAKFIILNDDEIEFYICLLIFTHSFLHFSFDKVYCPIEIKILEKWKRNIEWNINLKLINDKINIKIH